jgi:predicted  nucleic acid-binding Zn-ribbon protein
VIDTLRSLLQVQVIDAELKQKREVLAAVPAEREKALAAHDAEVARVEAARGPVAEAERQRRELEHQLADAEAQLAKFEEQKWEVTSKQAFAAIEREIGHANEAKSTLEDQILEQLDAIDAVERALAHAETAQRGGVQQRDLEEKERSAQEATMEGAIAALEAQRAEYTTSIEAPLLKLYDRVRATKLPVVLMAGGENCPGCHTPIAPQKRNDIRRGAELVPCLRCSRLLYGEALAEALRQESP